jgi:GT2 family glycosyltransferase
VALDVDVLIVSYDSATVLGSCVERVLLAMPGAGLAFREQGSDPEAWQHLERLAAQHPEIRLERDPTNPGFGAGCNALARGSNARWLMFLNPDATVIEWPGVADLPRAVIGATMVDSGPDGDHAGRRYRIRDEVARSWFRRRGPAPAGLGFVSGAAMLVPADVFRHVGGFDERYFLFYEDIDLCERINSVGVPTLVSPAWRVRHQRAHSTSTRFGDSLQWSYESGCRFHGDRREPMWVYRLYVAADATARGIVHSARHDAVRRMGYLRLARRALTDIGSSRLRGLSSERSSRSSTG